LEKAGLLGDDPPNTVTGGEDYGILPETILELDEATAFREMPKFGSGRGDDAVGQLNFL
jgi:hypothetical protein